MSQQKYATEILKFLKMDRFKWVDTPIEVGAKLSKDDVGTIVNATLYKKLAGSIMYLTTTRPDIAFAASYISRFMESLKDCHWKVGKRALRYIAGTSTYGLSYVASTESKLVGYTYSDYVGCIDDRKITYGYALLFGRNVISWSSKKQPIFVLSSI